MAFFTSYWEYCEMPTALCILEVNDEFLASYKFDKLLES